MSDRPMLMMLYAGADDIGQHYACTKGLEPFLGFELLVVPPPTSLHLAKLFLDEYEREIRGGTFVLNGEFTIPDRFMVKDRSHGACSDAELPMRLTSREFTHESYIRRLYGWFDKGRIKTPSGELERLARVVAEVEGSAGMPKRVVQIIQADLNNLLPHEEGYVGHCQTLEIN